MICSSGPWTTKEETKELRAHLGQAKMDKVVSQVVQRVGGFRRIAEGFGGAQQQQQYRYGGEVQQEETVQHAASSMPLKGSHVVDQFSQNLSGQGLLESNGASKLLHAPDDTIYGQNATHLVAEQTNQEPSPSELQPWHEKPGLQISQGS